MAGHRGNEEVLDRWATEGEGVAEFDWGADGDFDRCVAFMEGKGLGTEEAKGHCANLHHRALGVWPGREHGKAEDIMTTAVGWAPIVKSEKTADGTLMITGKAADSTLDRDYQIADPAWLDKAFGKWFGDPDGGNIREQHDGKRAIGNAVHYEKGDDGGHYITAEIVDPVAVLKIERNVLKGFSWSARNAATKTDKAAPGGRIVKGDIFELSVVDRPANPNCLISIAKADGNGDLQLVDDAEFVEVDKADELEEEPVQVTVKGEKVNPAVFAEILKSLGKTPAAKAEDGDGDEGKKPGHKPKPYKASESDTVTCPACERGNAPDAKHCDQCGHQLKGSPDVKVADTAKADHPMFGEELSKAIKQAERDQMATSGVAMPNGDFPIPDAGHLTSAVDHLGNYEGDKGAAKKHIIKRARALGLVDKLPDDWNVSKADQIVADVRALMKADDGDGDAFDPAAEASDVDGGNEAIAAIARLMISEAQGLAAGRLEELYDIQLLIQAVQALQYFVSRESDQEATLAMTDTDKADQATTETGSEPANTTSKAEGAQDETVHEGDLTKTELSALLDDAITKATQPLQDELTLVKGELAKVLTTPRPDGPARMRTTTQTAVASKADDLRREIALCETAIANTTGDMQKGYRQRLDDAQDELAKLDGAA